MRTIIVLSHLRWDFVYQRPQHLLSRLAKHYRIVFIEEPVFKLGNVGVEISRPLPNLTVYRPHTPVEQPAYDDAQMPYLRKLVREIGNEHQDPIVWFYTPMALPLLDELEARWIVYDCMDELSMFKNPPAHLLEREEALLQLADIVFTGGPSLYNAKRHRHPNVHCFPSSVDVSHFRQALDRNIADPAQRELPSPRLGFYGVIDERFDPEIVERMADVHPEWQIVLAGPIVNKIDAESLPRRSNIHYIGQQSYNTLPKLLAAWDVCLMPFAINDSTKFISPTKSLEYMAAELPIVSTPVKDVVDLHSDVVEIAAGPQAFVEACERVLSLSSEKQLERVRRMRDKLSKTSWDATAENMRILLEELDANQKQAPQMWGTTTSKASAAYRSSGMLD